MVVPKPAKERAQQQTQPQTQQQGAAAAAPVSGSGWAAVGKVDELFPLGKDAKAVVLPSGVKLCVYKHAGKVRRRRARRERLVAGGTPRSRC